MDCPKEETLEKVKKAKEEKVKSNSFDAIIFDLDGTLWNTVPVCTRAWNEIIEQRKLPRAPLTDKDMASIMGMTAEELKVALFPGIDKEEVDQVVTHSFHRETEILRREGSSLYKGVRQGLSELAKKYRLFLVSNCQEPYLDAFFEWSGFGNLFEDSECIGRTGRPKGDNISSVVQRNGLQKPVYVGDTAGDEKAARQAQVPFIFAQYGFGQAEAPDYEIASFAKLVDMMTK